MEAQGLSERLVDSVPVASAAPGLATAAVLVSGRDVRSILVDHRRELLWPLLQPRYSILGSAGRPCAARNLCLAGGSLCVAAAVVFAHDDSRGPGPDLPFGSALDQNVQAGAHPQRKIRGE